MATLLDKSIQAYRVLSAPANMSWKQHWVNDTFSHDCLRDCDDFEKVQFDKHLKECQVSIMSSIRASQGRATDLSELVHMVTDPTFKGISKASRQVIYSSANGERPIGKKAYDLWRGFQVVDMDIKDPELAKKFKPVIFNALHKCNWFLGVVTSSSGNGLHIYTKIAVPESDENDYEKERLLYLTNFRHKYSFVYIACLKEAEKLGIEKEQLMKWLDVAMAKPQQGAFIPYDKDAMFSTHFFEDFIYICFDTTEDLGYPALDWVSHPDLKQMFARWDWFENDQDTPEVEVTDIGADPDNGSNTKIHYKHADRWRMANTLVRLYGLEKGYRYLRRICSEKTRDKELMADCQTAARHQKPVDAWAINRLNTIHGFHIKMNVPKQDVEGSELIDAMSLVGDPNSITESKNYKEFHIKKNQYLGDILSDIMDNMGKITLLEAGPGLGKTEMVKQIAKMGNKVMMVQPFTSIIKSKVEQEPGWYNSYGNRKPKLDFDGSIALTMDKFSRLSIMDVKASGFDYIFIDESHLIFMSEYRSIMSAVINQIRSSEVPIILMSGTPIGELVFFNDIVHIKVIKEDVRKKDVTIRMVEDQNGLMYLMCRAMADDIADGKRVLFPTNEGTCYFKRIVAGVQYFLQQEHAWFDPIDAFYYKKSNVGSKEMDWVNFQKTIKNATLVGCTTYMGAGVDINDKLSFEIYFGDLCTAAECDQWCNRLRNNDLHVNMYIAKNDADGNPRYINKFKPLNLRLSDEDIKDVHSILRLCNKMIERNPIDYKYNTFIESIIRNNQYIKFNEMKNKYELDELSYKVVMFERKYREFAQQCPVFMRGMELYGYQVQVKDMGGFEVQGTEVFKDLKDVIKAASDENQDLNMNDTNDLLDKITEDRLGIYKEALQGHFEIKKGDEWKENLQTNVMTVKNVEIFEKVIPIFISLTRRFDVETVKEIFEFCKKPSGRYNFAAINRFRILINILSNEKADHLDKPIEMFMKDAYTFSDKQTVHKSEIEQFIRDFVVRYANKESDDKIIINRSDLTIKRMIDIFTKIFKCLIKVSRPDKSGMVDMERIEILWKTRDEKLADINEKTFKIQEFIEDMIDEREIKLSNG